MENNYSVFKKHMENLLNSHKEYENTKKYKSEIKLFQKYLEDSKISDKVFVLTTEHIDNYFIYCMDNKKINARNTLNTHISALKSIFEYLIDNNQRFSDQFGHVSTQEFRIKISNKLREAKSKELIPLETLKKILTTVDKYIEELDLTIDISKVQENRILKIYFVRLFIKMSLILPIKLSEMLDVDFRMFDDDFRKFTYNEFTINITNSLRSDILSTIDFIETKYEINHTETDKLFRFIANPFEKNVNTIYVSEWFYTTFNTVGLDELIDKTKSRTYSVEKIKKSAIWNMLNNGANIIHLSDYTGLSIEMLLADGIFSYNKDNASSELNSTLSKVVYYNYI